jgi:hypothetical protein
MRIISEVVIGTSYIYLILSDSSNDKYDNGSSLIRARSELLARSDQVYVFLYIDFLNHHLFLSLTM